MPERKMEDKIMDADSEKISIPYIAYESAMARAERNSRRLAIALVASIALMFASNALWLWHWTQYDYVAEDATTTTTYQQDGGNINIMGDDNRARAGGSGK